MLVSIAVVIETTIEIVFSFLCTANIVLIKTKLLNELKLDISLILTDPAFTTNEHLAV